MQCKALMVIILPVCLSLLNASCNKKPVEMNYIEQYSIPVENSFLSGVVLENSLTNEYKIGIKSKNGTLLIIENLKIPAGYHIPLVKISWSKPCDQIKINIDHDFGDNNPTYVYNLKEYSLYIE